MRFSRRMVIAGAVALAAVAGGGAALAASHDWGSPDRRQAVINDVAGRLGVTPTALQDAFKAALKDQVEAAVKAGTLTRAQADAIEARIAAGQGLGFGGPGGPRGMGGMHRGGEGLTAAATYLGVTEAQLRTQLQSGKTLADVAKAQGKTADGLVQAMVDAEKAELDKAVQSGRLTAAQEQQIVAQLKQRVTDMVNGTFGPRMHGGPGPGMGMEMGPGGPHHYFRQSAARSTPKTAL
jgi:hypothetical protein